MNEKLESSGELHQRRVPCLVAYLHPFRVVEGEQAAWSATLDQVNTRSWDYAALHEIVGGIEVGLPNPYHLVVARDGALALPPLREMATDQTAVEFFNRCLAALLIGGVYCETVTTDGLDLGSIIDWRYVRTHKTGQAAPNRFHEQIRYRQASPLEAIALHNPRTISIDELRRSMEVGLKVLALLPTLRGEYLLKGVTGIARRDWGTALTNLWIASEQLISALWSEEVVKPTLIKDSSKARRDQLADTRTWSAAPRIEMLFQKQALAGDVVQALTVARGARNKLAHEGTHPSERQARSAYDAVLGLLATALGGHRPPILNLDVNSHALSDPFAPPRSPMPAPTLWMPIPKLPGEQELEKLEALARATTKPKERGDPK